MLFSLLALLPYLCLVATIGLCRAPSLFAAMIDGALIWSLFIWLTSNLASLCNGLYQGFFIVIWLLYALALAIVAWRRKAVLAPRFLSPINGGGGMAPAGPGRGHAQGLGRQPRNKATPLALCLALICLCALVAALFYPPNMWDVHSYHLPRAMHWLQNHTLVPYPSNIPRQIGMPPFNALVAMQSLGMGGGDYFVNLGQWLGFVGLIAGAWRITAQLGGSGRACALAAIFMATLPNAVIHASNTESSNIVTFWLLAAVSLFLDWLKHFARGQNLPCGWQRFVLFKFGLCLGFAILSKGSAYVIALPFVLVTGFYCLKSPRKLFVRGLCAALAVILLNAPHYCRTWQALGTPVGGAEKNILAHPTPGTFTVNAVYNFLLHVPWLMKQPLREAWQSGAEALGVARDDAGILPWGGLDNAVSKLDFGDASAPNFLQALLLLAMLASIVAGKFRPPRLYAWCVFASFVLFCLIFTWHPWAARIQTALFALAAPLAGPYIAAWPVKSWQNWLVAAFLLWTFLVFQGGMRPVTILDNGGKNFLYNPRAYLYFNNYQRYGQPYLDMVNFLAANEPRSIGLEICDDAFEYPLWALLAGKVGKMPQIFHLLSEKDRDRLKPDYIVVMGKGENTPLARPYVLERRGDVWKKVFPPEDN